MSESRQSKWMKAHIAQGLCTQCSEPSVNGIFCLRHFIKRRELMRRIRGSKKRYKGAYSYNLQLAQRTAQTLQAEAMVSGLP